VDHVVFAYLDPGSGSIIIQALIAGLVAIPVVFRRQVARGARAARRVLGRSRGQAPGITDQLEG
jgi:hypothetical protein